MRDIETLMRVMGTEMSPNDGLKCENREIQGLSGKGLGYYYEGCREKNETMCGLSGVK